MSVDLAAMIIDCFDATEAYLTDVPAVIPPEEHAASTVTSWLEYVHEHAIDARLPGVVVLSAPMPKWKSRCYALDELDAAGLAAVTGSDAGLNMYYRVHLLDAPVDTWRRGGSDETRWVTHIASDVDIAGPGHKPPEGKVLPTFDQAIQLIDATLPPSAVIASGGGLYPIWRLAEPFEITSTADRSRTRSIGERLDHALASHGFHVDATALDLARVIRPPGVANRKPGRDVRSVTVLRGSLVGGGDFTVDQLEQILPQMPMTPVRVKPARIGPSNGDAPWEIFASRYDVDDVLAADPARQWEDVGTRGGYRAWRYVGSSSDYSIKQNPDTGVVIIWSATIGDAVGIKPGKGNGVDLWGFACRLAGLSPTDAATNRRAS